MSCDGDTISITAADKPAIEDVLLGLIPGLPTVHLHNKLLSPTTGGEDFLAPFRAAAAGQLEPFILVVEGSMPNQNIIEGDGYWTSFGNDPDTGQPLTVNWWVDRLAPRAWAVMAVGTCAAYGLLANLKPGHQETWVDYANDARAPLLFIAGGADHIMPASVNRSNAKHYEKSSALTDYHEFPGRSHWTCAEPGWEAVADYALDWAERNASTAHITG
jgi:Ni,Fe-hydrogenase I small subunit